MDVRDLEHVVLEWLQIPPPQMELMAAFKDFQGLLDASPVNPGNLRTVSGREVSHLRHLANLVSSFKGLLRRVLPVAGRGAGQVKHVVSPFVGGQSVLAGNYFTSGVLERIKLATLNPGRTGLAALGSDDILWWRVWHIAHELVQQNVKICVLPGARFAPGAPLPPGFPFVWLGVRSASWASIGFFIAEELQFQVTLMEDVGSDIVLWLEVRQDVNTETPALIIGGFYPRPGGDLECWQQILTEFGILKARFPHALILILGDGNVHLSGLVDHNAGCRCLHCRPTKMDRDIGALIQAAGLVAYNPAIPTHSSGTIIDLVLASLSAPIEVSVCQTPVGLSDHELVTVTCSVTFKATYKNSIGRVEWLRTSEWTEAINDAEPIFQQLLDATLSACEEVSTGCLSLKRRRDVLDAAAWLRNAVICLIGHSSSMVRARKGPRGTQKRWPTTIPTPGDFECYEDYKLALQELHHETNLNLFRKYVHLKNEDPGQAAHFLSSWFKQESSFEVALTHEDTQVLMSIQESLAAIGASLTERADKNQPEVNSAYYQIVSLSNDIYRAGAPRIGMPGLPVPPWNTAHNDALYAQHELRQVLASIKKKKGSMNGPLAALKAEASTFRELTRALVNLGRLGQITSSFWCSRKITPLRKAGPRLVRKVINLRPISQGTDMASAQDGLWLLRCQDLLERFSGPSQMGGKWDVMAVVVAVILHLQLRQFQGLDSYVLFADLKHAYDSASREAMLVACYSAGIVETEWMLLFDFSGWIQR